MKTKQHHQRRSIVAPLAAAALLAASVTSFAMPRFVLRVADHDGSTLFEGEAEEPYAGWIDVLAFGTSAELLDHRGGSARRGGCIPTDFTFHKLVDRTTPLFQEAGFRGLLLPAVQIRYLGNDDEIPRPGAEPLVVELHHVMVTGYRMHTPQGTESVPVDEIALNFSEVEYIYRQSSEPRQVLQKRRALLSYFEPTQDPGFDDDHDGLSNDLDPDDDNDGIADHIEREAGSNPFYDDANGDLDGDGQSNLHEAIAGTAIDDPASQFGIESIKFRQTAEGPEAVVSFPITGGRRYRLLASPNPSLPEEMWFAMDEFELPHGSPATGADVELAAATLNNTNQLFFRVEVSMVSEPVDPLDPANPAPGPIQ